MLGLVENLDSCGGSECLLLHLHHRLVHWHLRGARKTGRDGVHKKTELQTERGKQVGRSANKQTISKVKRSTKIPIAILVLRRGVSFVLSMQHLYEMSGAVLW